MSISLTSARRLAASAVGASAVAGAMLFGATPAANAAPAAPMPQVVGLHHVGPPLRGGYGYGHGGYGRGHGGYGRGWGHGGWGHRGWWW
jgi:hypothetical protein